MSRLSYDPTDVYFNIEISQYDPFNPTNLLPKEARYESTRADAIVSKASDYELSLIRFAVPGEFIPIQIAEIQKNQTNPNLMTWSLTLEYLGVDYQEFCIYFTIDQTAPVPTTAVPEANRQNPYYWMYEFEHILDIINTALTAATASLNAANPGTLPSPPFLIFDGTTQLFSIIAPKEFISAGVRLFMNYDLGASYFPGFYKRNFGPGNTAGKDIEFFVFDNGANGFGINNTAVTSPPDFFEMKQEFRAVEYWFDFKDLVFLSSSIPIVNEYTTQRLLLGGVSGDNSFQPILTDFTPSLSTADAARSILVYNPTAEFRMIDLVGDDPLRKIDIQIFWKDRFDTQYPLLIPVHQNATVKLLFRKKNK